MSKTKELTFDCGGLIVVPKRTGIYIVVEDPRMDELLAGIHEEDLLGYITSEYAADEIYSTEILEKWATDHGYIKQ